MHQNSTFIFIYTNSKLIIETSILSCKCCTWSWEFLHDLARFELLAHARFQAGASDLVHFFIQIIVQKVGLEEISILLAFLCNINFSVLFL